MSSVDDVYAAAASAEEPIEQAQRQSAAASQKAGEAATGLESAKDLAEQLAEASNALGLEPKAAEADAVRAESEGLAARAAAAAERLSTEAGELAAIKQEHTELLARIQALGG